MILGREFVGSDRVALILGDNSFYEWGLSAELRTAAARDNGATVFAYHVSNPSRYGVIKLAEDGRPTDLVEKPTSNISPWVVTGLYFFDNNALHLPPGYARRYAANWRSWRSTIATCR